MPQLVREIRAIRVAEAGILPHVAALRWAVHWAENPELSVFNAIFEFCNNHSFFALMQLSSFGRARFWIPTRSIALVHCAGASAGRRRPLESTV